MCADTGPGTQRLMHGFKVSGQLVASEGQVKFPEGQNTISGFEK